MPEYFDAGEFVRIARSESLQNLPQEESQRPTEDPQKQAERSWTSDHFLIYNAGKPSERGTKMIESKRAGDIRPGDVLLLQAAQDGLVTSTTHWIGGLVEANVQGFPKQSLGLYQEMVDVVVPDPPSDIVCCDLSTWECAGALRNHARMFTGGSIPLAVEGLLKRALAPAEFTDNPVGKVIGGRAPGTGVSEMKLRPHGWRRLPEIEQYALHRGLSFNGCVEALVNSGLSHL